MASALTKWTPEIGIQKVYLANKTPTLTQTWVTGEEPWSHELSEMTLSNCFRKIISVKNKSNFPTKFNSHLQCSLVSRVCSQIDGVFLNLYWWQLQIRKLKGTVKIFRMWKEISSENWVTQGWMRIGPHSQSRELRAAAPNAKDKQDLGLSNQNDYLNSSFPLHNNLEFL